jgi:hypothetical protein
MMTPKQKFEKFCRGMTNSSWVEGSQGVTYNTEVSFRARATSPRRRYAGKGDIVLAKKREKRRRKP